jgi:CheY-like chemotaxis protein
MPPDSPLRGPISLIKASGERAAAVVQDLLALARRSVPSSEILNLNRIVEESLESPEFRAMKKQNPEIRVETNLQRDLLNLAGSRVHLSKALMNLIANAAEAMPDGGTIVVETANRYADSPVAGFDMVAKGEYAVLTVKDSGARIEEEDLSRIFEPFYIKKVIGRSGSGLGMAVVWGTVKDHGGYINVKSGKDSGSSFELLFPATRRALPDQTAKLSYEEYTGNGQLILVVDDAKEQREIAAKILLRLGYRPETVSSGEEAVDFVSQRKPDLILLDMIMGEGIDGFETYRKILNIIPGQKAIVISGYSETERVRKTLSLGAGKYIRKPYTIEMLGMAIKKELET